MKSGTVIKQCVRFKGDFKKEKVQDELPGRDVAEFIAGGLREKNFAVQSVENEEIWFAVNVVSGSIEYPLMVCQSSLNEEYWEISCPRKLGFFARLFGKSEEAELQKLTDALDEILQSEKTITGIKWYSDFDELCDDYAKKRGEKRLSVVGKYLQKSFLPLCLGGWVLALVGGIRWGKESILLRVGTIMFLLPIASYFGFIVISGLWGLFDDIKESFQKKKKKKWLRWLAVLFFVLLFLAPFAGFFTGLIRNPAIERAMPTVEKYMFRLMILVFFSIMALIFGTLLVRAFSRIFIPRYRKNSISKELFKLIGSFLVLTGFTGFLSGFFAALGMLNWIPQSVEFPLAVVEGIDIDRNGNLFVACEFYSRIQVYNSKGDFVRGWFLDDTGGGVLKIKINSENEVEVAILKGRRKDVFSEEGRLIESRKYERKDLSFWDSFEENGKHIFDETTGQEYSVKGWVFTSVIRKGPEGESRIGRNAWYLFPFHGPFQAIVMGMSGMFLMGQAEKKKKRVTGQKTPIHPNKLSD